MARGVAKEIVGYGVEDQWVMEALRDVAGMAQAGTLQGNPLYDGSPSFPPGEAAVLVRALDQNKVRVHILPFDSMTYMDHQLVSEGGEHFFRFSVRCDVAAVVRGILGFDSCVYPANNKNLVQRAIDMSSRAGQIWPELTR